jgi:hypothetical protein
VTTTQPPTSPAPTISSRTTSAATPTAVRTNPRQSGGGGAISARWSGINLRASTSPATPSGTLMRKIHRHEA